MSLVYDPFPLPHLDLQAGPVPLHRDLFHFVPTMLFLKSSSQQMALGLDIGRSSLDSFFPSLLDSCVRYSRLNHKPGLMQFKRILSELWGRESGYLQKQVPMEVLKKTQVYTLSTLGACEQPWYSVSFTKHSLLCPSSPSLRSVSASVKYTDHRMCSLP